jgi:ATP-binding cassette subfamily B protein
MHIPLKQYWDLLYRYLRPQSPRVFLLIILLVTNIALRLVNPQIMRFFIDTATSGGELRSLLNAGILFFTLAVGSQILAIGNTYLSEQVAWNATNSLRLDLLSHILKLDASFFKEHTPGELLERIDGDVNILSNFFSRLVIYLFSNVILMLGILVLLFLEDWRIGFGVSIFALLSLLYMLRIRNIATPYWIKVRQVSAEFFGFLGETLSAMEDVRANGAERYVLRRFHQIMQKWYPWRLRAMMAVSVTRMSNVGFAAFGSAVAFAISAYLLNGGSLTIGSVYLTFYYVEMLSMPMVMVRNQFENLQQAEASISRIKSLAATRSHLVDGSAGSLPEGPLAVRFKKVNFCYESDQRVLDEVSFELHPGRVLGLLGRTGSGKTTLARLLLRLYDPLDGEIRLNGHTPAEVPLRNLRNRVSMVTQDVQLFQATVRDNLTLFNPNINDTRILAAIQELGLSEWYGSLSNGLETRIESGGASLSAGQAQLLAFARVFLANPGLVILDEASSRLDPATERLIERAVSRLLKNRTGIIIAHHLDTILRADEILILENGRVLEYGERALLAADANSHFSRLLLTGLGEVLA